MSEQVHGKNGLTRSPLALLLGLAACYRASVVEPCTLTCDEATPCPGDLVCGADQKCAEPGSTCGLVSTYIKATNTETNDWFGYSIALSADGSTLAIGASSESSAATGIDGDQNSNAAPSAGAVYVFVRDGSTWTLQAYVKGPASPATSDHFGGSVALSADGNTLAVGASFEDSAATGIDGDPSNNGKMDSGAAYTFTRTGATWLYGTYLKASNTDTSDLFGTSVALSSDGATLAVGAPGQNNDAGAVYMFENTGTWRETASLRASNTEPGDRFGATVALSGDGAVLVVGANMEDGTTGNPASNTVTDSGAAYVFRRATAVWSQRNYLKASNSDARDEFGVDVAISGDGETLAIGARYEASAARGVDADPLDNTASNAGAVYVFRHSGPTFLQEAYVKASNAGPGHAFGNNLALSSDGTLLAVGAHTEPSAATGIDGDQASTAADRAGAAYLFARGAAWEQVAYVKASNTEAGDQFGSCVAVSNDASTIAISALLEDSAARGVGGDQADNSAPASGAVYVFR